MPAVPKSGAGAPKRAAAGPAIVEDLSTLVPCPVITAHPNGFVERTEPERETHEVRCVPDNDKSLRVSSTTTTDIEAPRHASPPRIAARIAPQNDNLVSKHGHVLDTQSYRRARQHPTSPRTSPRVPTPSTFRF